MYVISHPENISCLETMTALTYGNPEMYIGVTGGTIAQRWKDHKALRSRDNQTTSRFIRDNQYELEDCFRVIFEGTVDQCYRMEYHLRNNPNMGMNRQIGGRLKHRKRDSRYVQAIIDAAGGIKFLMADFPS